MIKRERALKHINFTATTTVINITSIDTNARNGSTPNLLNWNKFIAIKYKYLVKLVAFKNTSVIQNIFVVAKIHN